MILQNQSVETHIAHHGVIRNYNKGIATLENSYECSTGVVHVKNINLLCSCHECAATNLCD